MKIVIAGGSGFLGGPLAEMYAEEGHDVRVLTRSLMAGDTRHDPGTGVPGVTKVGWKPDPPYPMTAGTGPVNPAGMLMLAAKVAVRPSRSTVTLTLVSETVPVTLSGFTGLGP